MSSTLSQVSQQVKQIIDDLPSEERQLLKRVLHAEQQRIGMIKPHGIIEDLRKAVEEVIKG